jgi:hypothetical protein
VAKERLRRKDLKTPDEFVTLSARTLMWLQDHRRAMTWVAGALLLLIAGLGLSARFRAARAHDANADLARALNALRDGDLAQATNQLKEVADRWNPSIQGQIATALKPSAELRRGERDATLSDAQSAVGSIPDLPPYLQQQLRLTWAVALEEKQQLKDAADKYAEAAAGTGPYRALALLGEARVRRQLGENDRARELYQKYLEEFPDFPGRELAEAQTRANS